MLLDWVGEMRTANTILMEKPPGKRPLERTKRKWEDNIKMDLWKSFVRKVDGSGSRMCLVAGFVVTLIETSALYCQSYL
jgi:hypothetical protein